MCRLRLMIGIFTGVRNSLYLKLLIKWECSRIRGSIILGIFMKFVGKTFSQGMSRNSREPWKSKANTRKPITTPTCPSPTTSPLNTISSWKSTNEQPNRTVKQYGLWSPLEEVKAREYFYLIKLIKFQSGQKIQIKLNPMLCKDTFIILYLLGIRSLIWGFMCLWLHTIRYRSIYIDQGLLGLLIVGMNLGILTA